jgi:hypothetical protein
MTLPTTFPIAAAAKYVEAVVGAYAAAVAGTKAALAEKVPNAVASATSESVVMLALVVKVIVLEELVVLVRVIVAPDEEVLGTVVF